LGYSSKKRLYKENFLWPQRRVFIHAAGNANTAALRRFDAGTILPGLSRNAARSYHSWGFMDLRSPKYGSLVHFIWDLSIHGDVF